MTCFVHWSQSVGLACKTVKDKFEVFKNIFSTFPAIVNFSLCCRMDGLHRLHSKVLTDKLLTQVSPRSQCRLWLCPHDRYRSVVTPAPSSASVAAVRSSIKIGSQYLLVARTSPMEDTRKTGGWGWSVPSAPHRHRTDRAYYRHLMFEYFMHEQKFTFLHCYALHKTQRHKNQFAVKQFKIDTKIVVLSHNNQSTENEILSLIDSVQCTLLVSICLQV